MSTTKSSKKKISTGTTKRKVKRKAKPKAKPLEKMVAGDFKLYVYLPRSYVKSRMKRDTNILVLSDAYEMDPKGKGISVSLEDIIKKISLNKTYAHCIDELMLLEVCPTNTCIVNMLNGFFNEFAVREDFEIVVQKEIDFKKYLALA